MWWLLLFLTPVFAVETVRVETKIIGKSAYMVLKWKKRVKLKPKVDSQEILIQFSRPWDPPELLPVMEKLKGWVNSLWAGYDSLLIQVDENIQFTYNNVGSDIEIILLPKPAKPPPKRDEAIALYERVRYERLRALFLAERGRAYKGMSLLKELHEQFPERIQIILDLATLEEQYGHWQNALILYQKALRISPNSRAIVASIARLLRQNGEQISAGTGWLTFTGGESHFFSKVTSQFNISRKIKLRADIEDRFIDKENVLFSDGVLRDFENNLFKCKYSVTPYL